MTKKRIKQFRTLTIDHAIAYPFLHQALTYLRNALSESLDEVERLKHRCKKRCRCGARCFRTKGHSQDHSYKKHKAHVLVTV